MQTQTSTISLAVAELNDQLRTALSSANSAIAVCTPGVLDLIGDVSVLRSYKRRAELFRLIASANDFTPDNDPYGEHDFGSLKFEGETILWKIDYYDTDLEGLSPCPADPDQTIRVLTVMLAREY